MMTQMMTQKWLKGRMGRGGEEGGEGNARMRRMCFQRVLLVKYKYFYTDLPVGEFGNPLKFIKEFVL